ncbi:MAG TPA: helix-hairpin-helix domain-containing protein [Candidatus Limnocylindrales bacterium]|nr:helix-hairpin-helix domain-containing protein [Candidatus Limnocylindrales bacterium]
MSRSDRIMIAAGGGALVLALAAGWLALAPVEDAATDLAAEAALTLSTPIASDPVASGPAESGTIVVDVQGAVVEPGVRQLPAGSRIADALAASGGYASDADLAAAAATINLAQALGDGEQIRVPRIGESQVAGGGPSSSGDPAPGGGGDAGGGTVDLNTATPEELEALPGIGPVTVQKIVAARQEQPFASLDDAVQRGVINRGQLEDIQGVATAG